MKPMLLIRKNLDAAGLPIREFSAQVESIDFKDY